MERLTNDKREKAIIGILLLLSAAASLSKLLIGFDIDEGYAIAMPYRLLQGDWLFREMWEIHQTSSLLPALFMLPFLKLTQSVDGMAIYLRICAFVIHLGMTHLVYLMLRRSPLGQTQKTSDQGQTERRGLSLWIPVLIYFNLLPKWMMSLDFSMQQLWGLTLICFCLYLEYRYKKAAVSILTGIALSLTILGYTGMIVLYPALLVWQLFLEKEEIKTRVKKAVIMTATCAIMALLFLALVLYQTPLQVFLDSIPQIFTDGTHSLETKQRLLLYARQWLNVAKQWLVFLAAGALLGFLFRGKTKKDLLGPLVTGVLSATSLLMIFGRFLGIGMGPFHFQARLLLIALLLILYLRKKEKEEGAKESKEDPKRTLYTKICYLSIVSFAGILLFSNVGPDSSSSYLSLLLTVLLCLYLQSSKGAADDTGKRGWQRFVQPAALLFLLSVLMCKGFFVRYTEYFPADILQHRMAVTDGVQKGIYLLEDDWLEEFDQRDAIDRVTKECESAMLLGTDQVLDLSMHCRCICPSTISTPAFNEQWITYLEEFQLLPQVVFLSKNTIDDREKFFSQNVFGKWLFERYDVEEMSENDSICWVTRKKLKK